MASAISFDIFKCVPTVIMALLQLRTLKTYHLKISKEIAEAIYRISTDIVMTKKEEDNQ
jgi:hypothetical protein